MPSCAAPPPPYPECHLIVLTGGPGAGKTAVLEIVRKHFCEHVAVLPEAASIVYGGGFPRGASLPARKAAQRAIYHVQSELERVVAGPGSEQRHVVALCDRGTLDGLAYWPESAESYWAELGTTMRAEQARYHTVIHLRTPEGHNGYNHRNPVRIETAEEAAVIDERIAAVWSGHPHRFEIGNTADFLVKAGYAIALIEAQLAALGPGHTMPRLPVS